MTWAETITQILKTDAPFFLFFCWAGFQNSFSEKNRVWMNMCSCFQSRDLFSLFSWPHWLLLPPPQFFLAFIGRVLRKHKRARPLWTRSVVLCALRVRGGWWVGRRSWLKWRPAGCDRARARQPSAACAVLWRRIAGVMSEQYPPLLRVF